MPSWPEVSRNTTMFSPRTFTRRGAPSASTACDRRIGNQNRRIICPIGASGPTWVKRWLSYSVIAVLLGGDYSLRCSIGQLPVLHRVVRVLHAPHRLADRGGQPRADRGLARSAAADQPDAVTAEADLCRQLDETGREAPGQKAP